MANYKVQLKLTAEKGLLRIPKKDRDKVLKRIQMLAIDPFPEGCRRISGKESNFRIRQGRYRIIYEVQNKRLLIIVIKIGHRKDIYRG